jgi:hypothetical protein
MYEDDRKGGMRGATEKKERRVRRRAGKERGERSADDVIEKNKSKGEAAGKE